MLTPIVTYIGPAHTVKATPAQQAAAARRR
jgi:hypothetical protein